MAGWMPLDRGGHGSGDDNNENGNESTGVPISRKKREEVIRMLQGGANLSEKFNEQLEELCEPIIEKEGKSASIKSIQDAISKAARLAPHSTRLSRTIQKLKRPKRLAELNLELRMTQDAVKREELRKERNALTKRRRVEHFLRLKGKLAKNRGLLQHSCII